jgi:hypothetical protein
MGGLKERIKFTEKQVASIQAAGDAKALEDALVEILEGLGMKDPNFLRVDMKERLFTLLFALKEKQPGLYLSKELNRYKDAKIHLPLLRKIFDAELVRAVDPSPFFLIASDLARLSIDPVKAQRFLSSHKSKVRFAKFGELPCYHLLPMREVLVNTGLRPSGYAFFTRDDQITEEALAKKIKASQA